MNKLFFISRELSNFLYADSASHQLTIINMGVSLFHRNISKFSSNTECIFRISQDGVLNLLPYMTKRLVYAPNLEAFRFFLMHKNAELEDITCEEVREQIANLSTGCFVLAVRLPKGGKETLIEGEEPLVEAVVMHKFTKAVNMMVSKDNVSGLHLRYLSKEEREAVAATFELVDK
jgi:hypothetical protein